MADDGVKLHDDLREVMGLLGKATPGPWEWSDNGNIIPVPYGDTEIAAVYSEHEDDRAPANAEAIIAAVAFLRQHGDALEQAIETMTGERLPLPADEVHAAGMAILGTNWLKENAPHRLKHGPPLLARQEGEDAERLDWLDKHAVSVAYERKLSPSSTHSAVAIIRHPMAEGHGTVRAFVDAARSGGGG